MRIGKPWRLGVLVTLLFLLSGQFCMLTTCLPRLARQHAAAHACCPGHRGSSEPSGSMPCAQPLVLSATASEVAAPLPVTVLATLVGCLEAPAPSHVERSPLVGETGPPHTWTSCAPSGLRAPPQG